jgi:hypothetical protein
VRPPALSGAAPPLAVQVPLLASRSGADSLFRALQPLLTLLPVPDGARKGPVSIQGGLRTSKTSEPKGSHKMGGSSNWVAARAAGSR